MVSPDLENLGLEGLDNSSGMAKYLVKELFKDDNLDQKTHLNNREIVFITKWHGIALKMNIKFINVILDKFVRLRVSLDREGRKEIVSMLKSEVEGEKNKLSEQLSGLFHAQK